MNNFSKTMAVIGISLGVAMLPISIISARLYFNHLNKSVISYDTSSVCVNGKQCIESNVPIVGMMYICGKYSSDDSIFLIPPTFNLNNASVSVYCMWERTNGHSGRTFSSFFPVFSNGVVDTSRVIGACYKRDDVPSGSTILYENKNFKFFKDDGSRSNTEEKEIYIFIDTPEDIYPKPMQNQTTVYLLRKKGQNDKEGLFVQHDRSSRYDIRKFYSNIDSLDDIDYGYYLPLS